LGVPQRGHGAICAPGGGGVVDPAPPAMGWLEPVPPVVAVRPVTGVVGGGGGGGGGASVSRSPVNSRKDLQFSQNCKLSGFEWPQLWQTIT
jgi:hypothetical protein